MLSRRFSSRPKQLDSNLPTPSSSRLSFSRCIRMDGKAETWCDRDEHRLFGYYVDFNDWFDGDEAASVREAYKVEGISVPSKAFYAGDKAAYDQAFKEYRKTRRHEVLNERYLCEQFTDNHWFERNLQRFDQLVDRLEADDVVPFIG